MPEGIRALAAAAEVVEGIGRETVVQETVMTRSGVDRILKYAFELARARQRLTSATKSPDWFDVIVASTLFGDTATAGDGAGEAPGFVLSTTSRARQRWRGASDGLGVRLGRARASRSG